MAFEKPLTYKLGYGGIHKWVKKYLVKPQTCRICNQPKKLDLANISQEYKRDLSDWEWLCRKCHMTKDGRINKLPFIGLDSYKLYGKWAHGFDFCIECATTKIKHRAHGLCCNCYERRKRLLKKEGIWQKNVVNAGK